MSGVDQMGFWAGADSLLQVHLSGLSGSDIHMPECASPKQWVQDTLTAIAALSAARLEEYARGMQPLWQAARLHQLLSEKLIADFQIFIDDAASDKLTFIVRPLAPGRVVQFPVRGPSVTAAKSH